MRDQAENLRSLVQRMQGGREPKNDERKTGHSTRIISASSGKGGVGKTSFTLNLAYALMERGIRVIVMDADLGLANVEVILGKSCPYNLYHVIRGEKSLKDVITEGPGGLRLISGGSGIQELANLTSEQLQYFVDSFSELDGTADILLIDTGAGISKNVLSFVQASDEAIVICTPEPTSITDAYGLVKSIESRSKGVPISLLVNRVESQREGEAVGHKLQMAIKQFLQKDIRVLGFMPDDPVVSRSVRAQQPFYLAYPNSRVSKAMDLIAGKIANQDTQLNRAGGFATFFRKVIHFFE